MARQSSAIELNNFVAGLVTEASPLTFPANASIDEANFELSRKGSRSRRLGIDVESGSVPITSSVKAPSNGELAVTSLKWINAGGSPDKTIIVVQIGNEINFFDNSFSPLTLGHIYQDIYVGNSVSNRLSYAVVDGMLVVVSGKKEIDIYEYNNGVITKNQKILYIRDFFGVTDIAYNK